MPLWFLNTPPLRSVQPFVSGGMGLYWIVDLREREFGKVSMKKIIATMIVAAAGWVMTANAHVFGVAFGAPGISIGIPAPSVYIGPGYATAPVPGYVAPATPYYSSPYYPNYYGDNYYPYAYGPSVTVAPFWGWGGGWGWRGGYWGGYRGGGWGGGWHGGYGGYHGGYHGGYGGSHGHR